VYDLRESHISAFKIGLANADWSSVLRCSDVQQCVRNFYDIFNAALSAIPVSFIKFTPKTKAWITPVIISLINKRWSAYKAGNFSVYNHFKKKVKCEILKSKKLWCQRLCKTSQGFWSVVRDTSGKVDRSVNELVALFPDAATAAESINSDFSMTFTPSDSFPAFQPRDNRNPHVDICCESLVRDLLLKLKTDKACGIDGILPFFLKHCADVISHPICYIFNLSFNAGIFPDIWKIADVCPIPKRRPVKRDQLRPISLLPIISKTYEKAVLHKYRVPLLQHYDECQFAYRPQSSTTCALVTIHETILNLLEDVNVGAVRIITFDMSRAFDRIPHFLLLSCIANLDLPNRDLFVNWLNSYLSNRQQRVRLGNLCSSLVKVTSGVPQGSILGPILFALYFSSYKPVDDRAHAVKYADDISLILPAFKEYFDDMSLVRKEISHFENWCDTNGMLINFSKTKILNVNFRCTPMLPVQNFENCTVLNILGLLFNDKLNWSSHFNSISKKISSRLYVLRVLKPVMSHNQLVLALNAIVLPLLDYASPVYLNCSNFLNSKLVALCKRAFRIIHGYDVKTCDNCNFLEVLERRKTLSLKLFEKALFSPNHMLHHLLPPFSHRSKRLILPFARTKRKTDGFVFGCSVLYNEKL
jgi:hypothetical protein